MEAPRSISIGKIDDADTTGHGSSNALVPVLRTFQEVPEPKSSLAVPINSRCTAAGVSSIFFQTQPLVVFNVNNFLQNCGISGLKHIEWQGQCPTLDDDGMKYLLQGTSNSLSSPTTSIVKKNSFNCLKEKLMLSEDGEGLDQLTEPQELFPYLQRKYVDNSFTPNTEKQNKGTSPNFFSGKAVQSITKSNSKDVFLAHNQAEEMQRIKLEDVKMFTRGESSTPSLGLACTASPCPPDNTHNGQPHSTLGEQVLQTVVKGLSEFGTSCASVGCRVDGVTCMASGNLILADQETQMIHMEDSDSEFILPGSQESGVLGSPPNVDVSAAPFTDVPVAQPVADVPLDPPVADVPVAPHVADVPVAPHVIDVPVAPHVADVPVDPHVIDVPVAPHVADVPVAPHVADVPVDPHVADVPVDPPVADVPVDPHVAHVPVDEPDVAVAPPDVDIQAISTFADIQRTHPIIDVQGTPTVTDVQGTSHAKHAVLLAPITSAPTLPASDLGSPCPDNFPVMSPVSRIPATPPVVDVPVSIPASNTLTESTSTVFKFASLPPTFTTTENGANDSENLSRVSSFSTDFIPTQTQNFNISTGTESANLLHDASNFQQHEKATVSLVVANAFHEEDDDLLEPLPDSCECIHEPVEDPDDGHDTVNAALPEPAKLFNSPIIAHHLPNGHDSDDSDLDDDQYGPPSGQVYMEKEALHIVPKHASPVNIVTDSREDDKTDLCLYSSPAQLKMEESTMSDISEHRSGNLAMVHQPVYNFSKGPSINNMCFSSSLRSKLRVGLSRRQRVQPLHKRCVYRRI